VGSHPKSNGRDAVYLKRHPVLPPDEQVDPFIYLKSYFPHFRSDSSISKYVVPIRPEYHRILFVDYFSPFDKQLQLFAPSNFAGNAIKLAYLCHAQTKEMLPGDLVLFYRSQDYRRDFGQCGGNCRKGEATHGLFDGRYSKDGKKENKGNAVSVGKAF